MTKKGKVFFIIASVLTALAVLASVLFTVWATDTLYFELSRQPEESRAASAIGLIFVIIIIIAYWLIAEAVLGTLSIIFSALSIKFTAPMPALTEGQEIAPIKKINAFRIISIVELVLAILSTASPFIYLGITNFIN